MFVALSDQYENKKETICPNRDKRQVAERSALKFPAFAQAEYDTGKNGDYVDDGKRYRGNKDVPASLLYQRKKDHRNNKRRRAVPQRHQYHTQLTHLPDLVQIEFKKHAYGQHKDHGYQKYHALNDLLFQKHRGLK